MANSNLFSVTSSFDFSGIQCGHDDATLDDDYHHEEEQGLERKQNHMFSMDDLGESSSLCSVLGGGYQERDGLVLKGPILLEEQRQLNELPADFDFQATQSFQEMPNLKSLQSSGQEMPRSFALSSLELLGDYYASGGGFKKLKGNLSGQKTNESNAWGGGGGGSKKLSTEDIMRVAGTRYVHFSNQNNYNDFSMVMHPFGYALSGLSEEETRDVELVHLLLAAAEKVGYQQFERASRLLSRCERIEAAERANPVQRIVFDFAAALRERIVRETTGNFITTTTKESDGNGGLSLADNGLGYNHTFLTCYQRLPFNQVMQFTGIQAIVENIGNASNKIHLVDFEIRSGVQWTSLMQALADRGQRRRPIQLLKITAVAFADKERVEEIGKSLSSVAKSLDLPFQFNVVYVSSFLELKEEHFHVKNNESLIVYCSLILRTMIGYPSCLENLLGVIKKLNPSLMVVIETEANHNSPSFVNRFIEALFFYSAYFDALETFLEKNTDTRTTLEAILNKGIRNLVAMEGTERSVRNVKMDVWRAFFSRFGMVEIGSSEQSWYQARMLLKRFPCASSCTLDKNGKSLIIGWKGTPIHSVSIWKFCRERGKSFLNHGS